MIQDSKEYLVLFQPSEVIFGGDTFIGKFGFKTKLPFFIDNRVGAPDDSDIYYDELGNVAYPQYWYSARSVLSDYYVGATLMKNIISTKAHYLDCPNDDIVDNISTTTTTIFYNSCSRYCISWFTKLYL